MIPQYTSSVRTFANLIADRERKFWNAYEDSRKAEAECRAIIQEIKESQRGK